MMKLPSIFCITVFVICSACNRGSGVESSSSAAVSVLQENNEPIIVESEVGKDEIIIVEQNEGAVVETYLIADRCAGPFMIDAHIPETLQGFDVTKSQEKKMLSIGETCVIPVYIYEIGNEGWVKVMPQYDAITGLVNGKIGEIIVYSDLFMTGDGIGAMSSIEEFSTVYPDFSIRYEPETELFVAETPSIGNVHFVIDKEYYQGDDSVLSLGESVILQTSDFRKESYFKEIRIVE